MMKLIIIGTIISSLILSSLIYFGGPVLFMGLAIIGIVIVILAIFVGGLICARTLINDGAQIAISSADNNDRHNAAKIGALAGLTREALKIEALKIKNSSNGQPALPEYAEGEFTISGLDK